MEIVVIDAESESVLGRFLALTAREPLRPLFAFVGDSGREEATLTVGTLATAASAVAAHLQAQGLGPGDRVLLAYPPSLDFVVGLVGAMQAGLIPVPVAPPDPTDLLPHLPRFAAMAESAGTRVVLSNRQYLRARTLLGARDTLAGLFGRSAPRWPDLDWIATDAIRAARAPHRPCTSASPDQVAVLQYTSGSTSFPRGVMITHGNLAHQLRCNAEELGIDEDSRAVLWVPHFHDFGLISGILSALWTGCPLTLMSPLTFLRRPLVWLEHLSTRRATHTAAPDFAYALCVRKTTPEQRSRLDLSALKVAMSAAEPVRAEVVDAFCEAFAAAGFRRRAFCPAYGLAEHTVGVSVGGRARLEVDRQALEHRRQLVGCAAEAPGRRVLVGCGPPSRDVQVRVVDPATRQAVPPGTIGEIWVDSPSKAAGYWGLPEDTRASFHARLADDADPRSYLRTGDLGALVEGEIYITGRLKDLLILRGRNLYPQDLEDSLRGVHPALRPGGVAAFSIDRDDGLGERLVLFLETREPKPTPAQAQALAATARATLSAAHQVACDTVVVGASGLVLKTTSGKIRRGSCRAAFLANDLPTGVHRFHEAAAAPPAVAGPLEPAIATTRPDRTEGLDPAYAAMIVNAARFLAAPSASEKRPAGVLARGELRVLDDPGRPPHAVFAAGRRFPVLLRHDNRTSADDAAPDARVAGLRLLSPAGGSAALLDLILMTGRCFFHRSAEDFFRFSVSAPEARAAILRAEPHRAAAAWEGVRNGASYTAFHYHSQTVSHYQSTDGRAWYARYRLRRDSLAVDTGRVTPSGDFPAANAPRDPEDPRSADCLRAEFRQRLESGGVRYRLELQLRPALPEAEAVQRDAVLDCTRPWPEETYPWQGLAELALDTLLEDADAAALTLNPGHAPPELGVLPARRAQESASIDHVRSLLYDVAAAARTGQPLPADLAALLARPAPSRSEAPSPRPTRPHDPPSRIAIVGAGASGLTLARALEQRGHRVTVIERDAEVGGMCQTREFDGVRVDLGGHMIFPASYPHIVRLARELGEPLVPDHPDGFVSLDGGRTVPRPETAEVRAAKQRVARQLRVNGALQPAAQALDPALALPIREWIAREGLEALWDWMGTVFVAAGYGYLEDEVPAGYLAKSFAHTGDDGARFQLQNGFQPLWQRLAGTLGEVRTGCEVIGATRDADGVTLRLRGPTGTTTERFAELVIAHAPQAALGWLDADPEERDLYGRVRTLDYVSAFLHVEDLPVELRGRWCFLPEHCADARRRGHALAFVQPDPARPVVAVIAYAPPAGVDALGLYAEDFARLGARLVRAHEYRAWRYFPHFGVADLRNGALDRLEALQGQRHTWQASTLASFELTECAAAYAEALAVRIDARLRGDAGGEVRETPGDGADDAPIAALRAVLQAEQDRLLAYLRRVFAEELERADLPDPDQPIALLGLDSLRAVSIHERLRSDSGLDLPPTLFAPTATLRALAHGLLAQLMAPPAAGLAAEMSEHDPETEALLERLTREIEEYA